MGAVYRSHYYIKKTTCLMEAAVLFIRRGSSILRGDLLVLRYGNAHKQLDTLIFIEILIDGFTFAKNLL